MTEFTVTITNDAGKVLYLRVAESESTAPIITEFDKALNKKPRKKRMPKGGNPPVTLADK